ncbi:MAG: iron-sulfur cluster assembly protein [Bacteroidales bacterium]|nr:iron-sulfur cluster assembly protein [Bacteroidales bacterium]
MILPMSSTDKIMLEQRIIQVLKGIYDPEIPVNIYDLGLVYDIVIGESDHVTIKMTLTAPSCPVAESLPVEVRDKVRLLEGVADVEVQILFDPPWSQDMISQEGMLELGFM